MKKIFRVLIFSGGALFLTSLWNKGFILPENVLSLTKIVVLIAVIYYLLVPLSKVVLFPINFLTFGLGSFLIFIFFLHFLNSFSLLTIKSWQFPGFNFLFYIPSLKINYIQNLFLSSFSLSCIINLLERII